MAKGLQDRTSRQITDGRTADKYMQKYAKDIAYFNKEHRADKGLIQDLARREQVPVREIKRKMMKASILRADEFTGEAVIFGVRLKAGARYELTYSITEPSGDNTWVQEPETIKGACVWIKGEYFEIRTGQNNKQCRMKYVRSLKMTAKAPRKENLPVRNLVDEQAKEQTEPDDLGISEEFSDLRNE